MSFILQIFHLPQAQTVAEAALHTANVTTSAPETSARFHEFVLEMLSYLPDLSAHDEDGENDQNFWPEGLAPPRSKQEIFNLSVKANLLTPALMGLMARVAAAFELQILDPQNALFYRADGTVIDGQGVIADWPEPAHLHKNTSPAMRAPLDPQTVHTHLLQALRPFMEAQSFTVRADSNNIFLSRDFDEVQQLVRLACRDVEGGVCVDFFWVLTCPALREHWKNVFSPALEARDDYWPTGESDFVFDRTFNPVSASASALHTERADIIANEDEMRAYGVDLLTDIKTFVTALLNPANTIQGLASVVLTEDFLLAEIGRRDNYRVRTAASQLILAALARPTAIERWIELARGRFDPYAWQHRLDDKSGMYLEKLIVYARSLARSAEMRA
jgi:hypothetical protein